MALACQLCSSTRLTEVIDLGHHPPSDSFLTPAELEGPEAYYPLKVYICGDCKLVQLSYAVDPKVLFTDKFVYRTGYNDALKTHFKELVDSLVARKEIKDGQLAVDIGSNDGTLLSFYPKSMKILGVDPASVADIAIASGIPTMKEFFNESLAKRIAKEHGKAKIITSTNTFAHIKDFHGLVKGIRELLADDGVFVQESHYFFDMVDKLQHDEIYLEHLRYYTVESLSNLFNRFDMELVHAERIDSHGGSIRTYAAKKGSRKPDESVRKLLDEEKRYKLNDPETLKRFRERANTNRMDLVRLLADIKKKGGRVVGVGAAAKGVSLMNFCGIGRQYIDYVVERSDLKIGKFTPGTHIPIVAEDVMFKDQPEYALLLAWNIKDILIPKLRQKGYKGKFILPNPTVEVV